MPLQLDLVGVSGANEYSVNPLALVSTVAPPTVAVFRLPAVAAAGLLVLVPLLPLVEEVADELHAARTAAVAATASSASSIRGRFRASRRVSDLIIASPNGSHRVRRSADLVSLLLDPPVPLRREDAARPDSLPSR